MKLTFEAINSSTHKLFINWASFCNLWRQPPAGHYKEYSLRHTASHLLHLSDLEATSMFFYTEHSLHATIPLTMPVKDSAHLTQFNKVSQKCQDLQAPSAAACSKQARRFSHTFRPMMLYTSYSYSKYQNLIWRFLMQRANFTNPL